MKSNFILIPAPVISLLTWVYYLVLRVQVTRDDCYQQTVVEGLKISCSLTKAGKTYLQSGDLLLIIAVITSIIAGAALAAKLRPNNRS